MPHRADPMKPLGEAVDKDGNLKDARDMDWPNDPDDDESSVPQPTTPITRAKKPAPRRSKAHQIAAQKQGGRSKAAGSPKKRRGQGSKAKATPAPPVKKQPHRKAAEGIEFDKESGDEDMQEIDKEIIEGVGESVDGDDDDDDRYAFHQQLDKQEQADPKKKKKSDGTADLVAIYRSGLGQKEGGTEMVKGHYCKICVPNKFFTGSSTSLRNHIASNSATHYGVYSKACADQRITEHWRAQGKKKPDSGSKNDTSEPEEWSSQGFLDHLIEVIVTDDQPFTMIDKQSYRNLFRFLRPSLKESDIPHRTKIREKLLDKLDEVEREIREKFKNVPSQISVTFDAWTSDAQDPFLAITAHYIDSPLDKPQEWSLNTQLIGFEQIEGDHSGENTAAIFIKAIDRYGLRDKLGWATSDNASVNDKALRYVQRYIEHSKEREWDAKQRRGRCMEHAVHLAAKHFLDIIQPTSRATLKKRKRPVQASNGRPAKQPRTQNTTIATTAKDDGDSDDDVINDDPWDVPVSSIEIDVNTGVDVVESVDFDPSDLLGKVLAFVTQIRLSPQSRAFLSKVCSEEGDPQLELVQYVRTRWASMHALVARVLKLRKSINKFILLADDSPAVPNLKSRKYSDFKLSSADWDALEILEEVLADTAKAHQGFSSQVDPTVWQAIPSLDYLLDKWKAKLAHSRFASVAPALKKGLANLKKWYYSLEESDIYFICLVLNPVIKTEYAKNRYSDEMYKKGMESFRKRFDEYYVKPLSMETDPIPPSDDVCDTSPDFADYGDAWMREITKNRRDVERDTVNPHAELESYLKDPLELPAQGSNVVKWWGHHASQYPTLSRMARDYLAIQGSSVASERAFSSAGLTDDSRRRSMDPKTMSALQILKSAYKIGNLSAPIKSADN